MKIIINEYETYTFDRLIDAQKFLENETRKWLWLSNLPPHLSSAADEIRSIMIDKPIEKAQDNLKSGTTNTIKLGTALEPFISNTSDEHVFIEDVTTNYGDIIGFFSIIYSNSNVRNTLYSSKSINESMRMLKFEYERVTAMNLSLSLGNYEKFMSARRKSEFQDMLLEQRNDQLEFRTQFNSISKNFKEEVIAQTADAQSSIQNIKKILHRRTAAINVLSKRGARDIQETVRAAKETHDAALERLNAADAAYTEQLELKYSVKYWAERKTAHSISKYAWLFIVLFSLILMLATISLYFASGGLTSISAHLSQKLPISQMVLEQQDKQIKPQDSASLQTTIINSEIASLTTNITGAIILITFLSIFVRISLRQFNIHTQYALAAGERVAFIKTYLALMKEKQIKSDEDRKLILECIFKSTLGTSTPEIAFSLPIDAMMKVLGEKRTTA